MSLTLDRAGGRAGEVAAERRARASERLLTCEGLFHLYVLQGREVVALQGVDLAVDWCEMVALLGPSGSGKSTMMSVMGGLERPSAGRVLLDGVDVTRLSEAQLTMLRRRRLGFVWQGGARNLLPHASAWENLEVPMLLADEPTSQLDRANVQRVVELLKEAREDLGTTVVLVTHDAEVAAAMDRTVTIRDGRVSAEGRGGTEYAVVGPTGSLHLPADALAVLPPGGRVTVEVEPDRVVLRPADRRPDDDPRDGGAP